MSALPSKVDVLIVGYGPVGAALAALLGRYGVHVLVIDKADDVWMAPRAIALDNEALRILQMVGLREDAFAKVGIPYVRMVCPHVGEFARFNTAGTIDEHPRLVTFYQPELERALRALVASHPSVRVRTGVELIDLEDEGDAVSAVLRMRDGGGATVQARYLIGADGASSRVRNAIGEAFVGESYGEDWLIVDARGVQGDFDHVEFLCDPDRPTPYMVAPGGRMRWEFMLRPGETRAEMESDASIARLLSRWTPLGALEIERRAVYRFHARVCGRFHKGRVFLAGDAAHLTPPFAGQGLVSGLRDAANLAWKLAWSLQGRASPTILDSYDEERRPHAARMIAVAKHMGRMIMPRTHLRALLLHGSVALLRQIPAVRALVDEQESKPANTFPRGLFVPGGDRAQRGSWIRQVAVRFGSPARLRSDDILGPTLALVGIGADPTRALSDRSRRRWRHAGGRAVQLDAPDLVVGQARHPWCLVVRPDRTILHDGPIQDAERLVRESLRLLGTPAA